MARPHPFHSPRTHGFVRVAAATPVVHAADPAANGQVHAQLIEQAAAEGVELLVFPELSLSGYAIDDLHMQSALLDEVERQILALAEVTARTGVIAVVGAPIRAGDALFNCAVVIADRLCGVVPKTYLPNYREYYEKRLFASGAGRGGPDGVRARLGGEAYPLTPGAVFEVEGQPGFTFGVEICEDYWAPLPPSTRMALDGARILLNLSASNVLIGKAQDRALLCASQSARAMAAYVFAASGWGESTTDLAWDGQATIHELGAMLAEGPRFSLDSHLTVADIDVDRIGLERLRTGTFADCAAREGSARPIRIGVTGRDAAPDGDLIRSLDRFPFVPDDPARLDQDCFEAFNIQVQGLMRRLKATSSQKVVIGVSGGLDSTQALLVACRAFDQLGLPRQSILGYSLPGFATSDQTRANALALMQALGVAAAEIDIRPTALAMLQTLGHPFAEGRPVHDITFENVQAGLRTDYLFRLANQNGGFVLGTGDLSEIALGWSTYGVGDHMSHYNVNSGVAKTLIRHLVRWVADRALVGEAVVPTLKSILATEISPELVPATDGQIQSTEALVGPYALNDFFLFYLTRFGLKPSKVAYLAHQAWKDAGRGDWPPGTPEAERIAYELDTIVHWLRRFLTRFFQTSQFKRSAMPNGPKVVTGGSLSPRGDWRAPSDVSARAWLDELDRSLP